MASVKASLSVLCQVFAIVVSRVYRSLSLSLSLSFFLGAACILSLAVRVKLITDRPVKDTEGNLVWVCNSLKGLFYWGWVDWNESSERWWTGTLYLFVVAIRRPFVGGRGPLEHVHIEDWLKFPLSSLFIGFVEASLSLSLSFASFSLAYGRFTSKVAPHRPTDRPTNQPPSIGGRRRGKFFFLSFFFDGGLGCQMVYSNGWGGRRDSMPNDVTVPLGVLTVTRP